MMAQGFGQIEERLARAIGLDTASVGSHLIGRAVETRMTAAGVGHPADYVKLLDASEPEMQALIEEVVVPESWFFRDSRPFEVLRQHARALEPARDGAIGEAEPRMGVALAQFLALMRREIDDQQASSGAEQARGFANRMRRRLREM